MSVRIILASQSPRRKQLLSYLVDKFEVAVADIDESVWPGERPQAYVERLAREKAEVIVSQQALDGEYCVIGSDTCVVYDEHILGKPESLAHCRHMLSMLSGKTHQVLTAFSVVSDSDCITRTVATDVTFTRLTEEDIVAYWQTGEPQDKAGAYAIQGIGGKFVESISGSVSNVVGLPLVELQQVLKEMHTS